MRNMTQLGMDTLLVLSAYTALRESIYIYSISVINRVLKLSQVQVKVMLNFILSI